MNSVFLYTGVDAIGMFFVEDSSTDSPTISWPYTRF